MMRIYDRNGDGFEESGLKRMTMMAINDVFCAVSFCDFFHLKRLYLRKCEIKAFLFTRKQPAQWFKLM